MRNRHQTKTRFPQTASSKPCPALLNKSLQQSIEIGIFIIIAIHIFYQLGWICTISFVSLVVFTFIWWYKIHTRIIEGSFTAESKKEKMGQISHRFWIPFLLIGIGEIPLLSMTWRFGEIIMSWCFMKKLGIMKPNFLLHEAKQEWLEPKMEEEVIFTKWLAWKLENIMHNIFLLC